MAKTTIQTSLLGKRVVENPEFDYNDRAHFAYFGLKGESAEIVGVWLDTGTIRILVRDDDGRTAELYPILYKIQMPVKEIENEKS